MGSSGRHFTRVFCLFVLKKGSEAIRVFPRRADEEKYYSSLGNSGGKRSFLHTKKTRGGIKVWLGETARRGTRLMKKGGGFVQNRSTGGHEEEAVSRGYLPRGI